MDSVLDYISNLIQLNEKSREIAKRTEVQELLLNISNEALIQTDSQNIIRFWTKSTELMFNRKHSNIIGSSINELFNIYNPEITLMIKDLITHDFKDHAIFDWINFNYVNKQNPK